MGKKSGCKVHYFSDVYRITEVFYRLKRTSTYHHKRTHSVGTRQKTRTPDIESTSLFLAGKHHSSFLIQNAITQYRFFFFFLIFFPSLVLSTSSCRVWTVASPHLHIQRFLYLILCSRFYRPTVGTLLASLHALYIFLSKATLLLYNRLSQQTLCRLY